MLGAIASVATVVLAGVISFVTALYVSRRDTLRKERVTFLLNAYRTLSDVSRRPLGEQEARPFEQALSDIGLLGERAQVELAVAVARDMAATHGADLDPLLASLRTALRKELSLPTDVPKMPVLRIQD